MPVAVYPPAVHEFPHQPHDGGSSAGREFPPPAADASDRVPAGVDQREGGVEGSLVGAAEYGPLAAGQCGVDPHLQFGIPADLECVLNRWKPAHTQIIFDLGGLSNPDDPMAGTP